jgi:hypothetical protein
MISISLPAADIITPDRPTGRQFHNQTYGHLMAGFE